MELKSPKILGSESEVHLPIFPTSLANKENWERIQEMYLSPEQDYTIKESKVFLFRSSLGELSPVLNENFGDPPPSSVQELCQNLREAEFHFLLKPQSILFPNRNLYFIQFEQEFTSEQVNEYCPEDYWLDPMY